MPIYEYQCSNCDHRFEKLQSFSAEATCDCPNCGNSAKRIISLTSFILKGTGWYVTDHPSKSRQNGIKSEKSVDSIPAESSKSSTASANKTTEKPAPTNSAKT